MELPVCTGGSQAVSLDVGRDESIDVSLVRAAWHAAVVWVPNTLHAQRPVRECTREATQVDVSRDAQHT